MRKKSHLALTTYLIQNMNVKDLYNHKLSFYVGSLWPDCIPSFITKKHRIADTFDIVEKEIKKITEEYNEGKGITRYYCRHLGIITHYLADYFTFPHNEVFTGSLKEHCIYEKHLKHALKEYVKNNEVQIHREKRPTLRTVDEICVLIKELHSEYLQIIKNIKTDCEYIVKVCQRVVDIILQIFEICFEPFWYSGKEEVAY